MPAPTQPTPDLQLPSSLISHTLPSASATQLSGDLPSLPSSSARRSQAAVGAAFKLSSDGRSVRRLKGVLPVTIKGHAVSLINPLTQTPVQSFTLSPSDQPCTAPLVILRTRVGTKSFRTTYFGVQDKSGQKEPSTEIWAFTEELPNKGKGIADGAIRKEVALVQGKVSLLHVLCSGHLVATHSDGSLSLLTHDLSLNVDVGRSSSASSAFRVTQSIPSTDAGPQVQLHVSLLDPTASQPLVASTSRIEEGTLCGLRIAVSSGLREASPEAEASKASRPKKTKKGRKSAIDVIDEVDGRPYFRHLVPVGEVVVSATALLTPVDHAPDPRLRSLSLGSVPLVELGDAKELLDVQMYGDGRLVALMRSGELISAKMSLVTGKPVFSAWRRIRVANLAPSVGAARPAAVLPLSRDHVLLVAIPTSGALANQESGAKSGKERVVALLLDLEVDAVLSQMDWTIPTGSQTHLGVYPSVSLSRVAGSIALVQLDPPIQELTSGTNEPAQDRINVLALPFVVPDYSVLRHAMGKGELTRAWTAQPLEGNAAERTDRPQDRSAPPVDRSLSEGQRQLVETLQSIATSRSNSVASQMENAFEAWISGESARLARTRMADSAISAPQDGAMEDDIDSILAKAEQVVKPGKPVNAATAARKAAEIDLPYNLVSALLPIILPESSQSSAPYPKKIVAHLLKRRAVSSLMLSSASGSISSKSVASAVGDSFLGRLRARNDWSNIMLAIHNVPDVSETDLVLLLQDVLRSDKRRLVSAANTKRANGAGKQIPPPSTVEFLASFVAISLSRPLLRGTLKARIVDVEDVAVMLQILKSWLDAAARIPFTEGGKPDRSIPPIELVLPFATDLLDTYFPLLISTASTHELLRSMSKTISSHLAGLNSLITLGAPLSAFAKLDEEKRHESVRLAAVAASRGSSVPVGPGGAAASAGNAKVPAGGKGAAAARAETGGGLGIGLGTEGVQKTRRAEAREESMLVGAYSFERLEI